MATTHVSALSSGVNLVMQKDYFTQDNVTAGTALAIFTGYRNAMPCIGHMLRMKCILKPALHPS